MRTQRVRFLLTFLSGVVAAAVTSVVAGTVGSHAASRYEDLSLFTSVMNLVRKNYVEEIDETRLVRGALRGMLEELDPHSSFMDAEAYEEMQVDTKGEFHGLGIEITKRRDGFIEVVSPIEGTPAARAGVRARDQIVTICPTERPKDWTEDCRSTKNMSLFDAVSLMRGTRGSKISLEILREGMERPQKLTITRDVVKVVSVSGRMLEPGYAYLRIRAFQERTIDDLQKTLGRLHEEGDGAPFRGLVIDVRDNPGGLLDQAVKVADEWLPDGLVVYTKGRVDSQMHEFRAHSEGTEPDYPIVVLVNEGTASASEIVAGALQDHGRALVLGVQTFGKGSVQTVYPLEDGNGLRLTTALYYTPGGRSIQEVGITPDIPVRVLELAAATGEEDESLQRVRERDLEGHFTQKEAAHGKREGDDATEATEEEQEPVAAADGSDVQLSRAVEVLKSWTYFERLQKGRAGGTEQARAGVAEPEGVAH
jgi:carboxyl-terminal processing protease